MNCKSSPRLFYLLFIVLVLPIVTSTPGRAQPNNSDHGSSRATQVEVTGRVLDRSTGRPLERTEVSLSPKITPELHPSNTDTTDMAGRFHVLLPRAGFFLIQANRSGYLPVKRQVLINEPGLPRTHITLKLDPGRIVRGRVTDADTEKPVAGVKVTLSLPEKDLCRETWTDRFGAFSLFGLPMETKISLESLFITGLGDLPDSFSPCPGSSVVDVAKDSSLYLRLKILRSRNETRKRRSPIVDPMGEIVRIQPNTHRMDLSPPRLDDRPGIQASARIEGHVITAPDIEIPEGTRVLLYRHDEEDQPQGLEILLTNGRFEFDAVPKGTYSLLAQLGNQRLSRGGLYQVEEGQVILSATITLSAKHLIFGRVIRARDQRPIAGARVIVRCDEKNGQATLETRTDAAGCFHLGTNSDSPLFVQVHDPVEGTFEAELAKPKEGNTNWLEISLKRST